MDTAKKIRVTCSHVGCDMWRVDGQGITLTREELEKFYSDRFEFVSWIDFKSENFPSK